MQNHSEAEGISGNYLRNPQPFGGDVCTEFDLGRPSCSGDVAADVFMYGYVIPAGLVSPVCVESLQP